MRSTAPLAGGSPRLVVACWTGATCPFVHDLACLLSASRPRSSAHLQHPASCNLSFPGLFVSDSRVFPEGPPTSPESPLLRVGQGGRLSGAYPLPGPSGRAAGRGGRAANPQVEGLAYPSLSPQAAATAPQPLAAATTADPKPSAPASTRPLRPKPPAPSPTRHLCHPLPPGPHHQPRRPSRLWSSPAPSPRSPPEEAPSLSLLHPHLCLLQLSLPHW